jgi:archaemetzincin
MTDIRKKVYIAFLNNNYPAFWINLLNDLKRIIPSSIEHINIPLDLKLFYSAERNQYHSTLILSKILNHSPNDTNKILGITNVDIYIPILTFLFGEAQLSGKGALVSTHRLHNEFYGLPRNDTLLYQRLFKEVLHELGHTYGLVHCRNYECAMHSSTYVEDIDLKMAQFCKDCQNKLDIQLSG